MKRIPCDLFKPGQKIYFNIARLAELEKMLGRPIIQVIANGLDIRSMLACFVVGLQHEGRKSEQFYADKIQALLEEGTHGLQDFVNPILLAIVGSGVLGKAAYYEAFPEEKPADYIDVVEEEKN